MPKALEQVCAKAILSRRKGIQEQVGGEGYVVFVAACLRGSRAAQKNKRMQLERQQAKKDELFNIEFEIWYTKLIPEDIAKIEATNGFKSLPIATFNKKMSSEVYRGMMKNYYRDRIMK